MNDQSHTVIVRKPLGRRLILGFSALLMTFLMVSVAVMTLGLAASGQVLLTLVFGGLGIVLLPIGLFIWREVDANWRWRIELGQDTLNLSLPAHRTMGHDTERVSMHLHRSDIQAVVTRQERYRSVGITSLAQVYALLLTNGQYLVLGDDRAQGTPYAHHNTAQLVQTLCDHWGLRLKRRPDVDAHTGYLAAVGNRAPGWEPGRAIR